jgi:hypothetical protein
VKGEESNLDRDIRECKQMLEKVRRIAAELNNERCKVKDIKDK